MMGESDGQAESENIEKGEDEIIKDIYKGRKKLLRSIIINHITSSAIERGKLYEIVGLEFREQTGIVLTKDDYNKILVSLCRGEYSIK